MVHPAIYYVLTTEATADIIEDQFSTSVEYVHTIRNRIIEQLVLKLAKYFWDFLD